MQTRENWIEISVGRQLHLTSKAARAFLTGRLAEVGATFGVWSILANLHTYGPMIQRELAARLSIEGPTLTRYLTQMDADGLVSRARNAEDRRAATVAITEAGQARYRKLEAVAVQGHAQLLDGFTDAEAAQLRDMLTRIERNVSS